MMGWFSKKAPSPVGCAADLSPQGEVKGAEPHLSLRGRGRHVVAGEGAFSERDCAIWQDIRRALEGGAK